MDLAALKNLDIKDIFSKIKAGGGANIFKDMYLGTPSKDLFARLR